MRVRNRMQVFANRRVSNRAWLLHALSGGGSLGSVVTALVLAALSFQLALRATVGPDSPARRMRACGGSRGFAVIARWDPVSARCELLGLAAVVSRADPASGAEQARCTAGREQHDAVAGAQVARLVRCRQRRCLATDGE